MCCIMFTVDLLCGCLPNNSCWPAVAYANFVSYSVYTRHCGAKRSKGQLTPHFFGYGVHIRRLAPTFCTPVSELFSVLWWSGFRNTFLEF